MPTNRYKCASCDTEWTYIGPRKDQQCTECGTVTEPQLPREINSPSVFEIVDKERNVKWRENLQERAKKRNAAGTKHDAKEIARIHGEDPEKHGWTVDDTRLV